MMYSLKSAAPVATTGRCLLPSTPSPHSPMIATWRPQRHVMQLNDYILTRHRHGVLSRAQQGTSTTVLDERHISTLEEHEEPPSPSSPKVTSSHSAQHSDSSAPHSDTGPTSASRFHHVGAPSPTTSHAHHDDVPVHAQSHDRKAAAGFVAHPADAPAGSAQATLQAAVSSPLPWGALLLLTLTYLQQSWSQFSLPIMLPAITADLHLTDVEGGLLTTGYTYLYALALPPVGMLADRLRRPNFLAAGVASWSGLTLLAASAHNFMELLSVRIGFAAAQAVQNPIAFALIAELFPNNKSAALALYNTSLYFGRALSFGSALAASELTKIRAGELALDVAAASDNAAWRDVLRCTAIPGFLIAGALLLSLPEPKDKAAASTAEAKPVPAAAQPEAQLPASSPSSLAPAEAAQQPGLMSLIRSPAFMTTTFASSFNDFSSYALLSFLSTFYERVHHMGPAQYAPIMAIVLPVGGIIGGVGGGWVADKVAQQGSGARAWITAGTNVMAAPLMALAFLADDSNVSFLALMGGYAMSEGWRAPAGNMARSCAPASMSSTAVSLYLSIRCVVGGLGPLGVALLTEQSDGDIQKGMLLVPLAYLIAGAIFYVAEDCFQKMEEQKAAAGSSNGEGSPKLLATPGRT